VIYSQTKQSITVRTALEVENLKLGAIKIAKKFNDKFCKVSKNGHKRPITPCFRNLQ